MFTVEINPVSDSGWFWCVAEIDSNPDDHDYLYLTVSEDPDLSVVKSRVSGSVTVQCLYSAAYREKQKQWCRFKDRSCNTVGKTDTSQNSAVHISDNERSFSVEMRGLKKSDAGWYWCSAGDLQVPVHLSVDMAEPRDPDLSVVKSRVSGAEGGSVTVQCLYSAAYRNTQKYWCRFKDGSCNTVGKTGTSQNSAVHISDNKRSFSVEMRGLKKSDAGWYWCSAGDLQVPVHISVGDEAPGLPEHQQDHEPLSGSPVMALCIIFGLLLVLVLLGWVIWKYKKNHIRLFITDKRCNHSLGLKIPRHNAVTYGRGVNGQCTASSAPEPDVTYSAVKISPHPSVPPVPRNDDVIYSSVKHQ
ncbi:polymeric immunoglobulin receptor-like [Clarias gariepinus]|uniref:polymeric immunoglobulin receptor-like n=1 Tax=Clarias gariepinus TaxID=13013 RepID=UPI00234E0D83|nr:polymeric immunoglobulin receptor-like [Clarias gariepinus]